MGIPMDWDPTINPLTGRPFVEATPTPPPAAKPSGKPGPDPGDTPPPTPPPEPPTTEPPDANQKAVEPTPTQQKPTGDPNLMQYPNFRIDPWPAGGYVITGVDQRTGRVRTIYVPGDNATLAQWRDKEDRGGDLAKYYFPFDLFGGEFDSPPQPKYENPFANWQMPQLNFPSFQMPSLPPYPQAPTAAASQQRVEAQDRRRKSKIRKLTLLSGKAADDREPSARRKLLG